jgi:hypothetical protein
MQTTQRSLSNIATGVIARPRRLGTLSSTGKQAGRQVGLWSPKQEKKSKMKLNLRQRLRNWLMAEPVDDGFDSDAVVKCNSDDDDFHIDHDSTIHFSVVPANGGKIVQIRYYDRAKDRNLTKLHIITPDEKLEEALAHIFQIEVLSR